MTDLKQGEVVRCFDRYIEQFWSHTIRDSLIAVICAGGVALVTWGHWVGKVLTFVGASAYIVWRGKRSLAFLNALSCPGCDRPVGDHFLKSMRLHIRCRHCGLQSPTDCQFIGPGKPSKVD